MLLRRTVTANPIEGGDALRSEVERTLASAHVLEELRLLPALRAGTSGLRAELVPIAERLLGAEGAATAVRVGIDSSDTGAVAAAAAAEVERWQSVAAHPLTTPAGGHAAQVLARTAEGLLLATTTETHDLAHSPDPETTTLL